MRFRDGLDRWFSAVRDPRERLRALDLVGRLLESSRRSVRRGDRRAPLGKAAFTKFWSDGIVPLFGLELNVEGQVPTDLGPFLVVCNHRSPLDIFVCVHLVGGVILANANVSEMPFVGYGARATDTIFVDRADERSGAIAIRQMRRRLKERRNVIVFPEGTTFAGDEVRPFKRGAFSAAREIEAKVLPVGVAYESGAEYVDETFGRHLLRMTSRKSTPIWIQIGEPLDVPRNAAETERVRAHVQCLVDRAAARRDTADDE